MAVKSTFKNMALCLSVICLVCSALLAGVYALTKESIDSAAAKKLSDAIAAVVPEFDSMSDPETVTVEGKDYVYYKVYNGGNLAGVAVNSSVVGFGGPLSLMVGLDARGNVYNTSVLSHAETPGLGAKCTESAFADQFKGWDVEAKSLIVKKDGGDVDAITASTITSRAYTLAVANAVKVYMTLAYTPMPLGVDELGECELCEPANGGQENE